MQMGTRVRKVLDRVNTFMLSCSALKSINIWFGKNLLLLFFVLAGLEFELRASHLQKQMLSLPLEPHLQSSLEIS
jgi:hypothetical protein